ncbi:MAG TPA: hypothetical protein VHG09_07205 [Longimicrobiales bacterium]|nr:hypothetical protein [Longimicrobiales bacterium]
MTREMTQVLRLQWLASRWLLVPLVLLCVALPQGVVRLTTSFGAQSAGELLSAMQQLSAVFPYLAAITGAAVALAAWNWDHRINHVYALTLPIPRARYAFLKLWAGAVILLIPALAIWIGAWIATSTAVVPDGLRTYPFAFGARFLLAAALVYGTMFALAAGTIRTTLIISIGLVTIIIGAALGLPFLERQFEIDLMTPLYTALEAIGRLPGPSQVFGGSWLLIDV